MKPILFSTPMVQAILSGRKTMTRRIIKPQPDLYSIPMKYLEGDILWVRETWQHTECININPEDDNYGYVYKADGQPWDDYEGWKWKPSLFMPRDACRLFLKVTNVQFERLNDITDEDARAEGVDMTKYLNANARYHFMELWKSINGPNSWDDNPWVWVVSFERTDSINK